jgi:hypothetical protein
MHQSSPSRRQLLRCTAGGIGSLALAGLLADEAAAAGGPLVPKPGHHPARA